MALSYYEYTADGVQQQYTSPPYLDPSHIQVSVGGTVIASSYYTLTVTSLTFNIPPVSGTVIRIARKTSQDQRLTNYEDASLLTADVMDADATQLFYMAQEAIDTASETNIASSTFYSSSTIPPDTANLGDLWYDAANKYLKIYNGTQWDLATPSNETFTYESSVFNDTEATLTYINVANLNLDIFVFLNGVKQVRADSKANLTATDPKDFFVDLDNNRVYFARLVTNDVVQVILAASDIGTNNHTQLETYTATANQTLFTLTNTYIPTTNTLSVYVNGVRQSAYTETNATTVTFTNGLSAGDEVTFITNQYQVSQGFTAAENVTYTPVGSSTATTVKNLLDNAALNPNLLINGGFEIWQRGTSFTNTQPTSFGVNYVTDRWLQGITGGSGGQLLTTREVFSSAQTEVPNNPKYYTKLTGNSLVTNTSGGVSFDQNIEDVRTCAGKKVTVTFYAKTSSALGRPMAVGTYQKFGGTGSASVVQAAQVVTLTTSWQKFSLTFDVPSISASTVLSAGNFLGLYTRLTSKGADNSLVGLATEIPDLGSDSVSIAQVKLEEGSNFTGWPHVDPATELVKCKRYYDYGTVRLYGNSLSVLGLVTGQLIPISMRKKPYVILNPWDSSNINQVYLEYPDGFTNQESDAVTIFARGSAVGDAYTNVGWTADAEF